MKCSKVVLLSAALAFVACGESEHSELPDSPDQPEQPEKPHDTGLCPDMNHPHAIDLGLSVKWSCCNVGANSPEESGGYFSWGEITEKTIYNDSTYLYSSGTDDDGDGWYDRNFNYNDMGIVGFPQYDVASAKMGNGWRMPVFWELEELVKACEWSSTECMGVQGFLVTGSNGNSIFLPFAGYKKDNVLYNLGELGEYWSGSLDVPTVACGVELSAPSYYMTYTWGARMLGQSVRAVK